MKKVAMVLSLLLVAVFIFGCATSPTAAPTTSVPPSTTSAPPATTSAAPKTTAPATQVSSEPIKIGALISLTGEGQMVGPGQKAALEYVIEQAGGQVAGRKIQLISEDDATNPVTGVDKLKKLLQFDKVEAIMGPVHGAVGGAVANFMAGTNIPEIQFMEKNIAVLKAPNKNVFLPWGTMEGLGYQAGLYAYDKLGYKTATLVLEDFNAGVDFTNGVAKAFKARGGTIVQSVPVKIGTTDFSPYITNLKQADAVFYWFTPPLAQAFTTQYLAAGVKMPLFMILAGQLTPPTLAQLGEKGVGITGCGHYSTLIDTPMNKTFVADVLKKGATNLLLEQSQSAYIAMSMYIEALKATNGDTSPAKILPALHNVKVTTPQGVCSVNADGLGIGDLYMMKVAKVGDKYAWTLLDKQSQVLLDVPAESSAPAK